MAKENSSGDSSLPLHEVLEAEFVALHGELPADHPISNVREVRLKALWAAVHGLKEQRAALCISGGGIRSATFGLGILQGLARCGLLDKFHYLSTVSGGGYVGSWLSAWIKNNSQGMRGVVTELKRLPDSTLEPEPRPIRHLREYSNYLTPKSGLTSVDFWTLIVTFIRNMFLNWLVLISWLAVAMMIPRVFLVPIYLHPQWNTWTNPTQQLWLWDIGLATLLMLGFALVAVAMAYAIIDVPSAGVLRLKQRHFLEFRQIPLLLASLVLAGWWAVFRTVHGSEPFETVHWLPKFVAFTIASYFSGELLATAIPSFRKRKQEPRPGRIWRFVAIMVCAALAGVCLWAIATRMFLDPEKIQFQSRCEAIEIPSRQKIAIEPGTQGVLIQIGLLPTEKEIEFQSPCEAIEISSQQKITIQPGTHASVANNLGALRLKSLPSPARHGLNYVCFAPPLILAVLLLVNFLFTGLTSWVSRDEDREWWGRSAAWILITMVAWIVVNVVVLWGAQAISATPNQFGVFLGDIRGSPKATAVLTAFGGVAGIAGGLLTLRSKLIHILGQKRGFHWLLIGVAILFFVLLAVVISWVLLLLCSLPLVNSFTTYIYQHYIDIWGVAFFFVSISLTLIILLFGIVMGFFINANKFSLHATYRNRLIRAYLAASRPTRNPNLFTGFDPADNFKLHELSSEKPLHVINGTLNLVHGEELAWQERKAESFTMSRLYSGSIEVGYRPSAEYGNGITLGTAMAISGAAANPNMGYHSSPVLALLMTLFNVRLGWWLGNPGFRGAKTWRRSGPRYSVQALLSEALGNTTDRYKYVNLSDGGHFENLGLYEMVLRRCHYIVVSDAGEDPEYSLADLGEAVRKIRIDFGIPIDFAPMTIYPRSAIDTLKTPGHNCAVGQIRYSVVDGPDVSDGLIVYIKPACYGDEPRDIYEYFKRSKTFPHESTADQFFSESQFESYRMLGAYTMERLCPTGAPNFRDFLRKILRDHLNMPESDWPKELGAA